MKKIKPPTRKTIPEPSALADMPDVDDEMEAAIAKAKADLIGRRKAQPTDQRIKQLESRVAELEGDLVRLVEMMGEAWGDIFKEHALEIVTKYQGE